MAKEAQLRVAEAKQRDIGRGKARVDNETMQLLGITAGDVIEIKGKKSSAAVAWPAYPEDQGKGLIRIDGIIRKNSGVAINDYVVIGKADVKEAQNITLAPIDMRLNVDRDFQSFVKNRLLEIPLVEGDSVFVTILGSAIPFSVTRVRPHGVVKVTPATSLKVLSEPSPEKRGIPRVTYEDIGGLHDEIKRVREMVELPLRHPELFQRLGIEPPKGVLLHGPPGCGKTLLAKAVANESDANFFSINGPEVMSKFYGESERRLREIFQKAQENSPSIIFIDELDAVAPKREEVTGEVERRVVAQLLALMDGLEARGDLIVIGATNRVNAIDPALRRPGRFDREVELGVPDKHGRYEILQIHTRGMPLSNVDLHRLSETTHGYTGADIAALCREAAMKALGRYLPSINLEEERVPPQILEKMEVNMDDFMNAFREITPTAMREVYIEVPSTRWSDVGGLKDVKDRLVEAVEWPIKSPDVFKKMGIYPPKGILLYGPPGCGKTLLARAVATESEANFISIKGPEVFSKWVGESLPYDEEVLILDGDLPKRIPIGELVEEKKKGKVVTFDSYRRAKYSPVSGYIKHKLNDGKKILEIKTGTGRKIRVTDDHSLFAFTGKDVGSIKTSELVEGESYIAIPRRLPPVDSDFSKINILEHMKGEEGLYVKGGKKYLRRAIDKLGYERVSQILKISRRYLYDKLSGDIPIKAVHFCELMKEAKVNYNPESLLLSIKGSNNPLPAVVKVDKNLCRVLGVWVAEGDYRDYMVRIHNSNPEIREEVRRACKSLGLSVSGCDEALTINSRLFQMFLEKVLGLKTGAENKVVPDFVLVLDDPLKAEFLKGYYSGDGWISGNSHRYIVGVSTTSEKLANDLLYLLLQFGIVAKYRGREEKKGKPSHIVQFMGVENFKKFLAIGFIDKNRNQKIKRYISSKKWSRSDQIPLKGELRELVSKVKRQWSGSSTIGRAILREVLEKTDPNKQKYPNYWKLVDGDVYWDKVTEISEVRYSGNYVYDISVNPTENFVAGFGGVFAHNSEKAIREIFRKGRMAAPAVIFIDELDSVVPRRGIGYADSGVTERVVSQLLTELDGIGGLHGVVVIGATNRPDILDPALLRPGRFDGLIYVPPPDEGSRLEIFKIHTKGMPLGKGVSLSELAKMTKGYSGADIEALCREAGMSALRRSMKEKVVSVEDFRIAMGKVSPSISSDMESWYEGLSKRVKRVARPATPVA